jgi:hypothetical protein
MDVLISGQEMLGILVALDADLTIYDLYREDGQRFLTRQCAQQPADCRRPRAPFLYVTGLEIKGAVVPRANECAILDLASLEWEMHMWTGAGDGVYAPLVPKE